MDNEDGRANEEQAEAPEKRTPTVHDGIAELDAKLAEHNTSVVGLLTHFAKTAFGIVLK